MDILAEWIANNRCRRNQVATYSYYTRYYKICRCEYWREQVATYRHIKIYFICVLDDEGGLSVFKRVWLLVFVSIFICASLTACSFHFHGMGSEKNPNEVKIGYFPNLTHIATIVALEKGFFTKEFGTDVEIKTKTVSNGALFMEAMATNAIDVGTVGPVPVLNFYVKDPKYHIISGAVNGGAVLVMRENSGIEKLKDLSKRRVAIPAIGSTQDIMIRKALNDVRLQPTSNGGDVELFAATPADMATIFIQKSVDVAATQEPWGYILETSANGKLLLDWNEFAWGKDSTNTVVAATETFLQNNSYVEAYLRAHKKAVEFIRKNPQESQYLVINHISELTGKEIKKDELAAAFRRLKVTTDVNEKVVREMAEISHEAGYIPNKNINGLIDLSFLEATEN